MGNQRRGGGFHLIFVIFFLIATKLKCLGAENSTTVCSEQEKLALLKFKSSVKDEFKMLSSWVGNDCCRWERVRCDIATGRVVSLLLRGNNIWNSYYFPELIPADYKVSSDTQDYYHPVGEDYYLVGEEVDSSLAELRLLEYLDLSGNDFQKSLIPEFIGSLKHLSYLNLSNAGFNGVIPNHIGNLSNLEVLDLTSPNQDLMAADLTWVLDLSVLKHLDLSGVDLKRAQDIDTMLYMVPSLVSVSLSHCSLINDQFSHELNLSRTPRSIQYLDLSKNFFKDRIPFFLQNMTSLAFLDISNSDFSLAWNLANFLNMIPSLSELRLSDCGLRNEHLSPTRLNFSTHSNIQHLDLSYNSIGGRFPYVFKNTSSLKVLVLHHNFLNSSVPVMPNLLKLDISSNMFTDTEHVGIWKQCHLKQLSVSHNNFREALISPSTNISKCAQYDLEMLYLDHNQFNGSIPTSLERLGNLRVLDLSSNELTNLIPESLGRLRLLEVLDLSSNQLNGSIPTSIGQLGRINFLDVSSNYLQGTVSEAHFANLSMLKYLDMSHNSGLEFKASPKWTPPFQLRILLLNSCKILDLFPGWLRTQSELKMLVLSNTSIFGPLPTWFLKMPVIPHLDFSHNNLNGPLTNLPLGHPFNVMGDEYKGSLLLQDNLFNGSIPRSLCRRTALEVLDLSSNRLTGKIPKCLGNLQKLRTMIFSSNELSGVIPSSIGGNSLLSWLRLNNNKFSGEVPQDLGNLHHLWILDLGENELSGKIPEWIAELTELMVLILHKNKFTGRIPSSLCRNPCLQILDVANNNLKGSIPRCVGELSGMIEADYCRHYIYSEERTIQVLKGFAYEFGNYLSPYFFNMDLSSNDLVGQIPEELMRLSHLIALNLSHNRLSGSIPSNIGIMKELESLDLSENKLTGMIPLSMANLTLLSLLNLSHNNLSGPIPTGNQLQIFNPSIFAGNEYLCGDPLPTNCSTTSNNDYHARDDPKKTWLYVDIMCGFATGFIGVIVALVFNKRWRQNFYRFTKIEKTK